MRIINVIEQSAGIITNVTSFAVWEEQLSNLVVEEAEKFFVKQITKNVKLDKDDNIEVFVEDGYYEEQGNNYYTIDIVWSEVE